MARDSVVAGHKHAVAKDAEVDYAAAEEQGTVHEPDVAAVAAAVGVPAAADWPWDDGAAAVDAVACAADGAVAAHAADAAAAVDEHGGNAVQLAVDAVE